MTLNAGCPVLRVMLFAATPISLQVFSTLIPPRRAYRPQQCAEAYGW